MPEIGPPVFLDYDQSALDAAYDQAAYAPNREQLIQRRIRDSELARRRIGEPERAAYGPAENHRPDTSRAGREAAPAFVFIHGGSWRSGRSRDFAGPAEMYLAAGAHYVVPDFALVQDVGGSLMVLADQVRRAVAWVYENANHFELPVTLGKPLRSAGPRGGRPDGLNGGRGLMTRIDLRSDTVTTPSPGMRRAMADAPVGDDQYGEDPSVNRLQERIAELLGKEAALFVPSGTMANQIGLKILTRPGDEVILGDEAHMVWHESGAGAANSGVQFTVVGRGGLFTAAELRAAYKPPGHIVFPPTTLVAVENTHNRGGGGVFPQEEGVALCDGGRELGMASYLDGARLFNAAAASGRSLAELAAPFDLVSVALSKGLGCPVGSVIAGRREDIARAVRARRMFGGAMRQSGILAAPGLWALDP